MNDCIGDIQQCGLEILRDFKKVCERNGLRYYLSCGSLLGAVRHHGFIPWDDDIDVQMPFEDYQRFLQIAQKEMGDRYFVQNSDTDPQYAFAYTHIRKNNTALIREWEFKFHSHHGVWMDVFPMLYIKGDLDYKIKTRLLKVAYFLRMDEGVFSTDEQWLSKEYGRAIIRVIKAVRKLPEKLRWRIREVILKYVRSAKNGKYYCFIWVKLSRKVKTKAFEGKPSTVEFEGEKYLAPYDCDQYLSDTYGDYMVLPPVDQRKPHGDYVIVDLERDWSYYCK